MGEFNLYKFIFTSVAYSMAKKRGLSADEKKQKMLNAMLAGVFLLSVAESSRNLYIT